MAYIRKGGLIISEGGGSSNLAKDIVWTVGIQLDSSGNTETASYARTSDYIDVTEGDYIVAYRGIAQSTRSINLRICGYDANGQFVTNINNQTFPSYTNNVRLAYLINIPSTVSKIRMSNPLIETAYVSLLTNDVGNY